MQVTSYVPDGVDVEQTQDRHRLQHRLSAPTSSSGGSAVGRPVIGDGDQRCYETWFFAVWAYNGWTADNPYPYQIWQHVADGPEGWWTGCP